MIYKNWSRSSNLTSFSSLVARFLTRTIPLSHSELPTKIRRRALTRSLCLKTLKTIAVKGLTQLKVHAVIIDQNKLFILEWFGNRGRRELYSNCGAYCKFTRAADWKKHTTWDVCLPQGQRFDPSGVGRQRLWRRGPQGMRPMGILCCQRCGEDQGGDTSPSVAVRFQGFHQWAFK